MPLSQSQNRRHQGLPSEILEQIISYISPYEITKNWATVSISWYLATVAAIRNHLRRAIRETEDLMCVLNGKTVVLDMIAGKYPEGTQIRWVPIKKIERKTREVMCWHDVLCRVVGFKL